MASKQQQQQQATLAGQQAASMRSSKTMPQLYYTREDIQEQYLAATKVRKQQQQALDLPTNQSSQLAQDGSGQQGRARAQSSGPKRRSNLDNFQDSSLATDDDDNDELEDSQSSISDTENRRRARRRKKRRKRSHSVSIFSACFSIPNLSSMQQQKRSILQHLGLNLGASSHQASSSPRRAQRPISASQTVGNFQQIEQKPDDLGGRLIMGANQGQQQQARLKHVSFDPRRPDMSQAEQERLQQQQQLNSNKATTAAAATACQQQQPASSNLSSQNTTMIRSAAPAVPDAARGRANNVIMRNYQAYHHLKQEESAGRVGKYSAWQPSAAELEAFFF